MLHPHRLHHALSHVARITGNADQHKSCDWQDEVSSEVGKCRAWAICEVLPVLVASEGGGETTIGHAADRRDPEPDREDRDQGEAQDEGGKRGGNVGEDAEGVIKEATVSQCGDDPEDYGE